MEVAGRLRSVGPKDMLHRLIIRFLLQKDDDRDDTWGRPLPGVMEWNPLLKLRQR